MVVLDAARFRVHASRRKGLQRLGIEVVAIAKMPLARDHGSHSVIAVRMGLDRGMCRHEQQDRIKVSLRWIAKKHFRMDALEARASDLVFILRAGPDFRRRHAHLRKRLRLRHAPDAEKQRTHYESFQHSVPLSPR